MNMSINQTKYIFHPLAIIAMIYYKLPIENLFLFYSGYCILMIIIRFYSKIKNSILDRSFKLTFEINLMKYFSLLGIFVLTWLRFKGYIEDYILLIGLALNVGMMLNRIILASLPRTYIDGQYTDLIEAVQFLLIGLKLIGILKFSWDIIIVFYGCYVYFMIYFGILCAFLFPILFGMSNFHSVESDDYKTLQIGVWFFYHVIWKAISYYILYQNLLIFLNAEGLDSGIILYETDKTLLPACFFLFLGGLINMIWFYEQKDIFTRFISLKMMIISKNRGVKRVNAQDPFDLKIMKAGSNYFKELISKKKIPNSFSITEKKNNYDFPECMICTNNEPNILIRPCNHGGYCEDCIINYLGTNNCCPTCKIPINKIYVMNYDANKNTYIGEKILTLV